MKHLICILVVLLSSGGIALADPTTPELAQGTNQWIKVDQGKTGDERNGAAMVYVPDLKQMLLVGTAKNAAFVQAFDPATKSWSDFSAAMPTAKGITPYYQTAYDPGTKTIYCLPEQPDNRPSDSTSDPKGAAKGLVLYAFNTIEKSWKALPAPELSGMSWLSMACDPAGGRLVAVGADKAADNVGWMRTVVFDIRSGKWQRLNVTDDKVVQEHRQLVAAREAMIEWIGSIRLAWYRDPAGVGSEAELAALAAKCAALGKMPRMEGFAVDLAALTRTLEQKKTLDALKGARALQRKVEELAEAQYPIPCSRRDSPLVYDAKGDVFILFGGDHEDYLINDTWVLDLKQGGWHRFTPPVSPSPRAGHALVYLPASGNIALYGGYVQSNNTDYSATSYEPLGPLQLWLYDPASDRWSLAGAWPLPGKGQTDNLAPVGHFFGYSDQGYSPPALAADGTDTLILAAPDTTQVNWSWKRPAATWTFAADPAAVNAAAQDKLGAAPNSRLYRVTPFLADYCEVPDSPKDTDLDSLPANKWVMLPAAPRDPSRGCRGRDWSTSVWDSDRDQILLWGGGHCVRAGSTVIHYSPVSGRMVEGYDADEPYGGNGSGGFDSSILDRPWVSVHNYKHYAYDSVSGLLVSARGYLYDPQRMDWLPLEPAALPYRFQWDTTVVATSKHGVVCWARRKTGDDAGLWIFDRKTGWTDLSPQGKLPPPYCDCNGMVYDSKRDRMILGGLGSEYGKKSDGTFLAFDFSSRDLSVITPDKPELAQARNAREEVYVEHADWILIGELVHQGDEKTGKSFTRVYDVAKNKMTLLDAGVVPDGHESGWMYDARRKLVYSFSTHGQAWALRIDPGTARLVQEIGQ